MSEELGGRRLGSSPSGMRVNLTQYFHRINSLSTQYWPFSKGKA